MLSPDHTAILREMVNRIIPADDYPGGWEGGVGAYLLRQFERDLKHLVPIYVLGLEALESEARAAYAQSFDRLPATVQDDLLGRIETGRVTTLWAVDPMVFFRMVVEQCAEGYYGDPGNGGNNDGASWEMIGFEVRG